jgi:hypothetical protein
MEDLFVGIGVSLVEHHATRGRLIFWPDLHPSTLERYGAKYRHLTLPWKTDHRIEQKKTHMQVALR